MAAEFVILVVLPVLLALAAGWDLASFTIPNFLQLALIGAFAVFAAAVQLPLVVVGYHFLAALAGLAIGFALFAAGYVGGGDAKLFACLLLWFGFSDFLDYALIASIAGGALTLVVLGMRSLPMPGALISQPWIARLHDQRSGIPYGVALALGAFLILPQTDIFRFASMH